LTEQELPRDPLQLFQQEFDRAKEATRSDATAMVLSTVSKEGRPSSRVVLLKVVTGDGFVFFTNYFSRKSREIADNARVALNFYWPEINIQIRVEGKAVQVLPAASDAYFATRPRISQLGAWASDQSQPLKSRQTLLDRLEALEQKYPDDPVPRPPYWGGFLVKPDAIEFWYNGEYRLHDRFLYTRELLEEEWQIQRLNP